MTTLEASLEEYEKRLGQFLGSFAQAEAEFARLQERYRVLHEGLASVARVISIEESTPGTDRALRMLVAAVDGARETVELAARCLQDARTTIPLLSRRQATLSMLSQSLRAAAGAAETPREPAAEDGLIVTIQP